MDIELAAQCPSTVGATARFIAAAYLPDFHLSQLGTAVCFAVRCASTVLPILHVVLMRPQQQVLRVDAAPVVAGMPHHLPSDVLLG